MAIRAVFFDLDDTLLYEMSSEQEAMDAACGLARDRHGVDAEALRESVRAEARLLWRAARSHAYCSAMGISSWEGLWGRFDGDDPNLRWLREWAPEYRRAAWTNALAQMGVRDEELADELSDAYRAERQKRHIPFPDCLATLAALRPRYKLGIVTNGAPDIQRDKIDASGIGRFFDAIVVSGEIGMGKPERGIFAHALNEIGAKAETAVMVGDSAHRDIAGAIGAGMKAVLITFAGDSQSDKPSGDGPTREPHARIAALSELPAALDRLDA